MPKRSGNVAPLISARTARAGVIVVLCLGVVSCGSSGTGGGTISDVDHSIEPTDEMQNLAEQQCLDDPSKDEGVVQAADPTTGEVLTEVKVDCEKIR